MLADGCVFVPGECDCANAYSRGDDVVTEANARSCVSGGRGDQYAVVLFPSVAVFTGRGLCGIVSAGVHWVGSITWRESIMVCGVCSVDRTNGEAVIRDYPRYKAVQKPCPNCGSVRAKLVTLSGLAAVAVARRRALACAMVG